MNYRTKQLTSGQHLEGAVPYLKGSHSTLGRMKPRGVAFLRCGRKAKLPRFAEQEKASQPGNGHKPCSPTTYRACQKQKKIILAGLGEVSGS